MGGPRTVVMARAGLAATPLVRALRPQALATRLAAVSLVAALSNAPLGVWRHHCEKFSPEWILSKMEAKLISEELEHLYAKSVARRARAE